MKSYDLTDKEYEIIREVLRADINFITADPGFLEQLEYEPRQYIDERKALAAKFNLDFWQIAEEDGTYRAWKCLEALYDGKTWKEFDSTFREPTNKEYELMFLKNLYERRKKK